MKTIITAIILITATPLFASEIYFGKYFDSAYRSQPDGGTAAYVGGVLLDKQVSIFKPRLQIETLMDSYNGNGSFHPSSVKYDVGVNIAVYDGTYLDVSRMCWHPVDAVGSTEEYWLIKAGYKW